MRTLIIGAGITGLFAARRLFESGLTPENIHITDKSRGVGGRMASRRLQTPSGTATIDDGAQFFTIRSETMWPAPDGEVFSYAIQAVAEQLGDTNDPTTYWQALYNTGAMPAQLHCFMIATNSRKPRYGVPFMVAVFATLFCNALRERGFLSE